MALSSDDGRSLPLNSTPNLSKNLVTKKQQKSASAEKVFAFGGTLNSQSKAKTRNGKEGFEDNLAVAGFSVAPRQIRPGQKRY